MALQTKICCCNHYVLLIFSLLCTIIVLTQTAVALPKPSSSSSLPASTANATTNTRMLSVLEQDTKLQRIKTGVLTPGQQVINAVPDKGKF